MPLYYGLVQFDNGEFWAACISLDEAWQVDPTELGQGLIFLAGGLCHLQRGNLSGCRQLLELAVEWLAPFARADREGTLAAAVAETVNLLRTLPADGRQVAYPKLGGLRAPVGAAATRAETEAAARTA